jgi:hypothetical protein
MTTQTITWRDGTVSTFEVEALKPGWSIAKGNQLLCGAFSSAAEDDFNDSAQ